MANDSQKNGLVKVSSTSLVRYSNALVRRGIEQMVHFGLGKKVLIEVSEGKLSSLLAGILGVVGLEVTNTWSSTKLENVYAELSKHLYDLVILTIGGIKQELVLTHVSQIKSKYPDIKIVILLDHHEEGFSAKLYSSGVNAVFSWPPYYINDEANLLGISQYRIVDGEVVGSLWQPYDFAEMMRRLCLGFGVPLSHNDLEQIHKFEVEVYR